MTDDTDYSKEPISISTLKAQRSEKAHDWTARDALIDVLREIDGEKLNVDAVFIVYRIRDEDGKWSTKFRQRTPDFHTSIGMIEHIKHRILSDD